MSLRMHRVPAASWERLATNRLAHEPAPSSIDLVALEAETDLRRRVHAEIALIQAYVDALEPQRAAR